MQQFFLLSTCFLGLIFSDFGPSSRAVLGKATLSPSTVVDKSQAVSPLDTSPSKPPPTPPPPQSLAQVQNDAGHLHNLSMADICTKFTNGSHSEFYSPQYPSNYAKQADCYKIISAGPGQVIRIKFLDHFHIEYEEHCQYDFLEIRDGRFGYSTVIQKVCGTFPPPAIQSSGRHLWLRFHSDSDIQYIGFKAVYEFLPANAYKPDLDECALINTKLEDYIGTANISQEVVSNARAYEAPVDCTWMIHAGEQEKIYITFDKYELEKPNDCTYNFIEIYGSDSSELTDDSKIKQYCGSKAEPYSSKGNILYIRFFSMIDKKVSQELKSTFEAYYSFFRDKTATFPCKEFEIDCNDNTCIDESLRCNLKPNCKLRVDEDKCPKRQTDDKRYDIPVIASLGCVLIVGMCGGLFLNIYRKLRQDRKDLIELREALRKSRESMLAMQIQSGIIPHGPSPPISSQDSGESKQTVVERPLPPNGGGSGSNNGKTIQAGTSPPTPKKQHQPSSDTNKQFRVQAESSNAIPYSPPPPYLNSRHAIVHHPEIH
ncbi:unnamed protein product [Allacma fusca]|uniref:CUB domain-containing protein n=1 Tax=Allacma fusca TaxID=39272 RepID=A0A8J2KT55_9HEXA|nr:unnamed protein product [Allacma fusca]